MVKDMKREKLTFEWPETGHLEVLVKRTDSAVLRYEPSEEVIQKMLEKYRADCAELERRYHELSESCGQHMRTGHFAELSDTYAEMAGVLEAEGRYTDELKMLMLTFYLDLSGVGSEPHIRSTLPELATAAFERSKMSKHEMTDLYLETIRRDCTSRHTMTVLGSLRLFELCILGKVGAAERILNQLSK